jgi:hypothetical protein
VASKGRCNLNVRLKTSLQCELPLSPRLRLGGRSLLKNAMAKAPQEIAGIKRLAPRRRLTKKQAVRHLIHAAVRMIAAAEDPFAIHLIIQSADKLLIDLSKRLKKPLAHDWVENLKDEYRKPLMAVFRETYNFLKHADSDHDEELHVGSIAESNVLQLAVCTANYHALSANIPII